MKHEPTCIGYVCTCEKERHGKKESEYGYDMVCISCEKWLGPYGECDECFERVE